MKEAQNHSPEGQLILNLVYAIAPKRRNVVKNIKLEIMLAKIVRNLTKKLSWGR